MILKEKLNVTIEQSIKEKVQKIATETGWSISRILELLIGNTTTQDVKKIHEKELRSKN